MRDIDLQGQELWASEPTEEYLNCQCAGEMMSWDVSGPVGNVSVSVPGRVLGDLLADVLLGSCRIEVAACDDDRRDISSDFDPAGAQTTRGGEKW